MSWKCENKVLYCIVLYYLVTNVAYNYLVTNVVYKALKLCI